MAANIEDFGSRQYLREGEPQQENRSRFSVSRGTKGQQRDYDLQFAIARANRAFANLKLFRATHGWAFDAPAANADPAKTPKGIERAAIYPESHVLHFSILAGLVLFEGLANAYFFSTGSDLGLLGGWLQAITVSFTNVIAAFFLIGFLCLRHLMNPKKLWFFVPAAIGLPIAIAFIVVLNLAAAHYRDLLELNAASLALGGADVTGAILAPLPHMFENPFGLQTLEAYLLLTLGLTFAAIAAFKGRTFDDAIPGYGVVQRNAEKSARELNRTLKKAASGRLATPEQVAEAEDLLMEMANDLSERERIGR
jgi:hypothetical protein